MNKLYFLLVFLQLFFISRPCHAEPGGQEGNGGDSIDVRFELANLLAKEIIKLSDSESIEVTLKANKKDFDPLETLKQLKTDIASIQFKILRNDPRDESRFLFAERDGKSVRVEAKVYRSSNGKLYSEIDRNMVVDYSIERLSMLILNEVWHGVGLSDQDYKTINLLIVDLVKSARKKTNIDYLPDLIWVDTANAERQKAIQYLFDTQHLRQLVVGIQTQLVLKKIDIRDYPEEILEILKFIDTGNGNFVLMKNYLWQIARLATEFQNDLEDIQRLNPDRSSIEINDGIRNLIYSIASISREIDLAIPSP